MTGTRAVAAITRSEMGRNEWSSAAMRCRMEAASLAEALAGCSARDRSMSLCLRAGGDVMQQLRQCEKQGTPAGQPRGSRAEHRSAATAFRHGSAAQQRRHHRIRSSSAHRSQRCARQSAPWDWQARTAVKKARTCCRCVLG